MTLSMLKEITEKVRPPRSLLVPFPLGYPLGRPHDPELQRNIISSALAMVGDETTVPGEIRSL